MSASVHTTQRKALRWSSKINHCSVGTDMCDVNNPLIIEFRSPNDDHCQTNQHNEGMSQETKRISRLCKRKIPCWRGGMNFRVVHRDICDYAMRKLGGVIIVESCQAPIGGEWIVTSQSIPCLVILYSFQATSEHKRPSYTRLITQEFIKCLVRLGDLCPALIQDVQPVPLHNTRKKRIQVITYFWGGLYGEFEW